MSICVRECVFECACVCVYGGKMEDRVGMGRERERELILTMLVLMRSKYFSGKGEIEQVW